MLLFSLSFCLILSLGSPSVAQTNPALGTAVQATLDAYLVHGPAKKELGDGSAIANWALLSAKGIPTLRSQPALNKGDWNKIWSPVNLAISEAGFSLRPLQVLPLWEQTKKKPDKFLRLLAKAGVLDPKKNDQRARGKQFRAALDKATQEMKPLRGNSRYEVAGWKYTGTVSLEPSSRVVRIAIRGSQPCPKTGSARTVGLSIKGRIFEDPGSESGIKVQILSSSYQSAGCRLNLSDRIDSIQRLSGGGEAKLAGNLSLRIRDESVTGRFQVDLVSKQVGVALLTGRAVYTLRGGIDSSGALNVILTPVSTSGSRVLKQLLDKEGSLTGTISKSTGKGQIILPVLKDKLDWQDAGRKKRRPKKKGGKR